MLVDLLAREVARGASALERELHDPPGLAAGIIDKGGGVPDCLLLRELVIAVRLAGERVLRRGDRGGGLRALLGLRRVGVAAGLDVAACRCARGRTGRGCRRVRLDSGVGRVDHQLTVIRVRIGVGPRRGRILGEMTRSEIGRSHRSWSSVSVRPIDNDVRTTLIRRATIA